MVSLLRHVKADIEKQINNTHFNIAERKKVMEGF